MSKRDFIICFLWFLLGWALFYSTLILAFLFNMFSWDPEYGIEGVILMTVSLVLVICCFILAKFTQSKIAIWFSLFVSLVLLIIAFIVLYEFYTESISKGFFSRSRLSPHWFRLSIFSIYLTAIISWLIYPYKYLKQILIHDKITVLEK